MNTLEALETVLELANQGALEDQDASGDEVLEAEIHKQQEAIFEMEKILEDFRNSDQVIINPQEEVVHT